MKKSRKISKLLFFFGGLTFLLSCNQVSKKNSTSNRLNLNYQISILPSENVKQFLEQGDTFSISAIEAYELLKGQEKVKHILADTQHYQRKLLIGGYPKATQKSFNIEVREFVDARASIIASFSVNAYTGEIFFEPKPFSEAYKNGLWKIPIDEWDSKLE